MGDRIQEGDSRLIVSHSARSMVMQGGNLGCGIGRELACYSRNSYNNFLCFFVTVALAGDVRGATRSTGIGNGSYKEVLQRKAGLVDLVLV